LTAIAQVKSLVRIDRHQISKSWTFAEFLRLQAPYGLNGHQYGFAFLSLDLTGNRCSFGEVEAASYIRVDYHFGPTRSISPVRGSDSKLSFVDTFQYSSSCIGHRNVPWVFLLKIEGD
jgi:hypothetical protein